MRLPAFATSEHRNWRRRQKQKHWRRWWKEGAAAVAWEGGRGSGGRGVEGFEGGGTGGGGGRGAVEGQLRFHSMEADALEMEKSIVFTYEEIINFIQLAALINDSIGVICTNTSALQLANAHEKRSIALFFLEEKGRLFVPNAEEKRCVIISSKTGKLADIDVDVVKTAMQQEFAGSLVLA
ncbi:hypothetical protein Taro_047985 [Colocasia esculenta]|uniref:Uncharacterized protein n=1 Tax=Colocasia esculenta TaxID=4460 RepID=A0A843X4M2_COLES|nr:hypothetical protein [Colocasia esculenta]